MKSSRTPVEQWEHDRVIGRMRNTLETEGKNVETNPGSTKENPIIREKDVLYPDIFVHDPTTRDVLEIYEVETEGTVNEDSINQWKTYSMGKNKFFLVVPKSSLKETKELVNQHNIKVDGYYYY